MRRWVFALLLLVLPFQMVWASAAPYCAHETSTSASKHFGHHEHRHYAGGEVTPSSDNDGNGSGTYHADCGTCHLGCAATLSAPIPVVTLLLPGSPLATAPSRYISYVPAGPERPDRSDFSAAVRSGGGVVSGPYIT
ncbi:MAG: hypothetical protein H3C59_04525 [Burkholderiaceae bacterium]|jgi:hypothetical protein|nr:hypothetical protein [Burkholderiaceae bacterium]